MNLYDFQYDFDSNQTNKQKKNAIRIERNFYFWNINSGLNWIKKEKLTKWE